MSKINVLVFTPAFSSGGAEAYITNLVEALGDSDYSFDIVCLNSTSGVYDSRLQRMQVNRIDLLDGVIENPVVRYFKAFSRFKEFLKESEKRYDVAHFHIAQGEDFPFVQIAKKEHIPRRIVHSHSSSVRSKYKYVGHILFKALFSRSASDYLACSEVAAEWLFPKDVLASNRYFVARNGINTTRFRYSTEARKRVRKELGIDDKKVIVQVASISECKNQSFSLDCLGHLAEETNDYVLLLVGEGELRQALTKRVQEENLGSSVVWTGNRDDIPDLLSASDVFILPSLFEGLPYSVVEAQASGLPCVISDAISSQCILTDLVVSAPLDKAIFSSKIKESLNKGDSDRKRYCAEIAKKGYDISESFTTVKHLYELEVQSETC